MRNLTYCRTTNVIVFGGNEKVTVNRTLDRQTGIQAATEICEM
jgi:hypothetical protein